MEQTTRRANSASFWGVSLRPSSELSSRNESPLVPLNLVPEPTKHGTVVQSSPVPFNEAKQTHP
ncbi:hypothetical protein DVH24_026183 [Malus domestica]|uniref:Uncharacterized protein n=1 Tax=Malus domestica TaxID=3750 RepID=A0A498KHY0_MALDO|nr:hypothetical protein DVH24_026183 [Malus domestica]